MNEEMKRIFFCTVFTRVARSLKCVCLTQCVPSAKSALKVCECATKDSKDSKSTRRACVLGQAVIELAGKAFHRVLINYKGYRFNNKRHG